MTKSFVVVFDVSQSTYDPERIFRVLQELSTDRVWNFIPGVFGITIEGDTQKIYDIIPEDFDHFLVIPIDPIRINGRLPKEAWDSWLLATFFAEFEDRESEVKLNFKKIRADRIEFLAGSEDA